MTLDSASGHSKRCRYPDIGCTGKEELGDFASRGDIGCLRFADESESDTAQVTAGQDCQRCGPQQQRLLAGGGQGEPGRPIVLRVEKQG